MLQAIRNRQPWRFIVVSGAAKADMVAVMRKGIEREKEKPLLPGSGRHITGAESTMRIMASAQVVVFVMNQLGIKLSHPCTAEERISEICNAQSIGAAVENMTLAATELGLGSLWICDTYFAYEELCAWLCTEGELFAALVLGYADENPVPRTRNPLSAVVEWRKD